MIMNIYWAAVMDSSASLDLAVWNYADILKTSIK